MRRTVLIPLAPTKGVPTETYEAVVTCPWCDYYRKIEADAEWRAIFRGKRDARVHHRTRHPDRALRTGAEPRVGFYRGNPIN